MATEWYHQAKGVESHGAEHFLELLQENPDAVTIVDFFMPQCHYCVKFMPEWNRIVDEFKAEYGEQIQFIKVNGTADHLTASRYGVQSFPHFIYLEPGTMGDKFTHWKPMKRDYLGMKKWIN